MDYNISSTLSKSSIYDISSPQFKSIDYYQEPMEYAQVTRKKNENINEFHSQSYIDPTTNLNTYVNSSSFNGLIYNSQNNGNSPSYNYDEKANLNISSIYNSYSAYPTYPNIEQPKIIKNNYEQNNVPKVKILPTKYLPTKFNKPEIIYGNIEFSKVIPITKYTNLEPSSSASIYEQLKNDNSIVKKTEKSEKTEYSEYNIPNLQTYFNSNTQNASIPETNYYSTPETNSYSFQQISSYSTQEIPSYSTTQYNIYNYKNDNELQNINYEMNNQLTDIPNITDINSNTLSDVVINDSNNLPQEYDYNNETIKSSQQETEVTKKDYLINTPKIYKESTESPVYNSYMHKSPEIYYKKDLFSPIQSPLANYETQSYNGDENFNIEEMLRLKEENEFYKQQLKELDKYKKQAAEARELRIQVEQLSPLKEKLSEIESLKAQLRDLNELKANSIRKISISIRRKRRQ